MVPKDLWVGWIPISGSGGVGSSIHVTVICGFFLSEESYDEWSSSIAEKISVSLPGGCRSFLSIPDLTFYEGFFMYFGDSGWSGLGVCIEFLG